MSDSKFSEAYKHPLWQKKRLEVLERDGWKCRWCSEADVELQVHHRYYVPGRNPWEYPMWSLTTMCRPCHKKEKIQDLDQWENIVTHLLGNGSVELVDKFDSTFRRALAKRMEEMNPDFQKLLWFKRRHMELYKVWLRAYEAHKLSKATQ